MIFVILAKISAKEYKWLDHFLNYVKSETYQVLLLLDSNEIRNSLAVENILQKFSKNVPTSKITFEKATDKITENLRMNPLFYDPYSTTIFVLIYFSDDNQDLSRLQNPISFISRISGSRMRPRCLFVILQEEENSKYEALLQHMWFAKFLDVTLVDLLKEEPKSRNRFLNFERKIVTIHRYNPFSKIYTRENFKQDICWFPEKTSNLYGHEMKVGLFSMPPTTLMELSPTGKVINASGPDVLITHTLSKAMNFKILWVTSNVSFWGTYDEKKNESTGLIQSLINNEINYVIVQAARIPLAYKKRQGIEISYGTRFLYLTIAIPNFENNSVVMSTEWKLVNVIIIISLFLCPWVLSYILQFERRNWNLLYILQIVFGQASPCEPRKLIEKIVFCSMLLISLLYSSSIETTFTSIGVPIRAGTHVLSIKDATRLNLKPVIDLNIFTRVKNNCDGSFCHWINNSIKLNITYEECIDRMVKEKNIVCLARHDIVKLKMNENMDSCGQSNIKMTNEHLASSFTGMLMESASPYVRRFNVLLHRLLNFGIIQRWQTKSLTKLRPRFDEDDTCQSAKSFSPLLKTEIFYIFAFGFSSSFIGFLCEILSAYIKKKFQISLQKK